MDSDIAVNILNLSLIIISLKTGPWWFSLLIATAVISQIERKNKLGELIGDANKAIRKLEIKKEIDSYDKIHNVERPNRTPKNLIYYNDEIIENFGNNHFRVSSNDNNRFTSLKEAKLYIDSIISV